MTAHQTADDAPEAERVSTRAQAPDKDAADEHDPSRGSSSADTPPRSISKDDAFHVLQNARRRAVLRYLLDHPDQARFRMRDLAEETAAWEHDTTVRQLTSDQRQRVYIALYQSHLPKLDEHHVIEYNQPRGVVEPTALLAAFEPFLEDGLHADTQHLTVDDGLGNAPAESGCQDQTSLVPTLSGLFSK